MADFNMSGPSSYISFLTLNAFSRLIIGMFIFNLIIVAFLYTSLKSAMVGRERELDQERDKNKRYWEYRDLAWKDQEDELKRVLHIEKEREISQLRAEL
jgi:F0F1-type ATP synthase membrane subunit b/b'